MYYASLNTSLNNSNAKLPYIHVNELHEIDVEDDELANIKKELANIKKELAIIRNELARMNSYVVIRDKNNPLCITIYKKTSFLRDLVMTSAYKPIDFIVNNPQIANIKIYCDKKCIEVTLVYGTSYKILIDKNTLHQLYHSSKLYMEKNIIAVINNVFIHDLDTVKSAEIFNELNESSPDCIKIRFQ